MTVRHWTITTHHTGKPRDVDVYLYDKNSHMRAAAARHSNSIEPRPGEYKNAAAVCHGFQRVQIDEDGTETDHPQAAIIRFSHEHLNAEVISHEVAHAAQHLYGIDMLNEGDLAVDHFTTSNEPFAYLAGDLFAAIWTSLYEATEEAKARQ